MYDQVHGTHGSPSPPGDYRSDPLRLLRRELRPFFLLLGLVALFEGVSETVEVTRTDTALHLVVDLVQAFGYLALAGFAFIWVRRAR
jgi:hypothetical protein